MKILLMRFYEAFIGLFLINSTFAVYTAIQYFPENAIYEIDESTLNATKILDTEDVVAVSITNDPVTGHMFVITGAIAGEQTLNRLCEGKLYPIAPISPPAVNLYCLTSGPNGVYAVESSNVEAIGYGKLNVTTGAWTNITRLLASYDSVVVAQNDKGVIHHINGNGKTFINPGSKPKMDVLRGTKFPPGFINFCGEFDDDGHIISTTDEFGGGISKYNLKSERIKMLKINDTSAFFFNDITIGSNPDACPSASDAPSMLPKSSKKGSKKRNGSKGSKSAKNKKKKNKKKNKTKTQNKIEITDKEKKNKDKKEDK